MAKVYVVNEPMKRNHGTGELERAIDLSPASRFGELVFLLSTGHLPADPVDTLHTLARKLEGYTSNDFLLPVGHPALIGWATAYALRASDGEVNMLCWQPKLREYVPVRATLWEPGDGY